MLRNEVSDYKNKTFNLKGPYDLCIKCLGFSYLHIAKLSQGYIRMFMDSEMHVSITCIADTLL